MSESGSNRKGGDFCNLEYLLVNLGRNRAAAERLIHIFLENAPTLCRRLEKAAVLGDLPALRDVLHDIRSSCVLFSGNRCLDQARDIEQLVREHLLEAPIGRSVPDWSSMSVPLVMCIQCMEAELADFLGDRET
ncbi:MAG: Hpt domain-containing protein [Dechloromonas sp.]|uniref:Hpt domain-containing protein n=1 Tax=Azonexaceae TaxID=2008795 RepID=UPI001CF7FB73|nr:MULTISPECIES: Hpt domain-containing protein [Azonexaceae]MBT9523457.1 Hpt domain-containing protein [Dechloromonas sp.]UCV24791.1 Hpt domain-containing protein [Ferribacterium limneticum]